MDHLQRHFDRDLADLFAPRRRAEPPPVAEEDLAALPSAAGAYLRAMGVIGRPRYRSVRAAFQGRFRRSAASPWLACDAWQYDTNMPRPTRVYDMRLRLRRLLPVYATDTYVLGSGRMRGKLLDLVPVVKASGPELDISELVTYLSDAVLLAPSLLLDDHVTWVDAGPQAFELRLTDGGRTVSGRVDLDHDGLPTNFLTFDRWCALPTGLVRAPWSTPVDSWRLVDGRPIPGLVAAVWDLLDGPFRYVEGCFVPGTVEVGAPAAPVLSRRS